MVPCIREILRLGDERTNRRQVRDLIHNHIVVNSARHLNWRDPGSTNHGFKGFCSVLVASSFVQNSLDLQLRKRRTRANRCLVPLGQLFWRIAKFCIVSLLLVGLLVPYNEPRIIGGESSVGASASPFVIAVEGASSTVLPRVMNLVILTSVLSVGNFDNFRVL
ncbi:hypothetical protein J3458_013160 [Metarhizium acridum]|uniref:uncharacterized protein n=1 Tax=Metarhizium acridum TaxID=92637 RepID=UPI001C6C3444|nr:hypothetical protein J3458_013160 [Metarhizium acridum]